MVKQPSMPPVRCFAGLMTGQQKAKNLKDLARFKIEIIGNFRKFDL